MTTILTLRMDAGSQGFFEEMRQRYFPAERNQIPAHLSLFHTLPGTEAISAFLAEAAGETEGFALSVTGLRSLGKGVAYTLVGSPVMGLHGRLAERFAEHLSVQDRQRLQPHVVVQNKVTPEAARALLGKLQASFQPFEVQGVGLDLWEYLGGPWRWLETFGFQEATSSATALRASRMRSGTPTPR